MSLLSSRVYPTLTTFRLGLSPFALECIYYAGQPKRPSSPTSPTLDTATTVSSDHAVSDFERISYYNGITDYGDNPNLLYRTGSTTYPWTRPTGKWASVPVKSLRGVYNTPLNKVWDTVGPQIRDLVKQKAQYSSIDPARFVAQQDGEETLGPVTIWIAVPPGSTSADTAHDVSEAILALLVKNGVEGAEVEWREAVLSKLSGPALLRVVGDNNPTAYLRRHLTAALGMPIATRQREVQDGQGSVTFFFHENRDNQGRPSTKVFGVSNHHVLRERVDKAYEFKGAGAPRQYVCLNGFHRFQKGLDEIKVYIGSQDMLAELYAREIIMLEERAICEDVGEDEVAEDAKELQYKRDNLAKAKKAIGELGTSTTTSTANGSISIAATSASSITLQPSPSMSRATGTRRIGVRSSSTRRSSSPRSRATWSTWVRFDSSFSYLTRLSLICLV